MKYIPLLLFLMLPAGCQAQDCGDALMRPGSSATPMSGDEQEGGRSMFPVQKSEDEWKTALTEQEYRVLRQKGTEVAFTGKYYKYDREGRYRCAGCGAVLFSSGEKYHSGSGWPSFYAPAEDANIVIQRDESHGMVRDEVLCGACGGHLGHVFNDGPRPTGLRYCINSVSLDFDPVNPEESGEK